MSQVTSAHYVGDIAPPTSLHKLSKHETLTGVSRWVCNPGVHELLRGKMDTISSRGGLLPKRSRHQVVPSKRTLLGGRVQARGLRSLFGARRRVVAKSKERTVQDHS